MVLRLLARKVLICKSQTLNHIKSELFKINVYASLIKKEDIMRFMQQTESLMSYNNFITLHQKKYNVKFIQEPINFNIRSVIFDHLKEISRLEKYPELYPKKCVEKKIAMLKYDACLDLHRDFLDQPRRGKIFSGNIESGSFFVNTKTDLLDFPDRYIIHLE